MPFTLSRVVRLSGPQPASVPSGRGGAHAAQPAASAPIRRGAAVARLISSERMGRGDAAAQPSLSSAATSSASTTSMTSASTAAATTAPAAAASAVRVSANKGSSDSQRRVQDGSARPSARKARGVTHGKARVASSAAALVVRTRLSRNPARPAMRAASAGVLRLVLTENCSDDSDEVSRFSESDDPDDDTGGGSAAAAAAGRRSGAERADRDADIIELAAGPEPRPRKASPATRRFAACHGE